MKSVTVQVMFDAEHGPVLMITSLRDGAIQRREYAGFYNNQNQIEREFGDLIRTLVIEEYERLEK